MDPRARTEVKITALPRPRRPRDPLIYLLPNLLTTANLFCGFFAMVMAIRGEWFSSAVAILIAAFTDGLDGRVARLTHTQSAFGEQYDSMSDLVSFGAAPALLMLEWALSPLGRWGWTVAFLYLACAALRLARFNVLKQNVEKRYFQGMPSPLAACTVAAAVLFHFHWELETPRAPYMLAVTLVLALAMVSKVHYRSFKDFRLESQTRFAYLLLIIASVAVVVSRPELFLFPIFLAYLIIGIVAESLRFLRRRARGARKSRRVGP